MVIFIKNKGMQAYGISAELPTDLSSMDAPYYEIVMRVNSLSDAKLYFSVGCGNNCMGSIELPVSKMAEWEAINVPLSCLKKDGLSLTSFFVEVFFVEVFFVVANFKKFYCESSLLRSI